MKCIRVYRCVLCVVLALVVMSLQAQEQQRKVTPVKPSTNKVLTPPKGTDERIIQQYLSGDTVSARAQEREDSLAKVYPHYPKLTELALGLNFGDALLMAFGQKYASFDLHATLNILNRFQPMIVMGLGRVNDTPQDMNFTYTSKLCPYFKLGINYNFLYKSDPRYQLYVGGRLGYTYFKYDITNVSINNSYWGEEGLTYELRDLSANALWGEFLAGLKVCLTGNWALGWEIKFHGIFKENDSDSGKAWYIPGYGTRNGKWAFGISLFYTIPLNKAKWPNQSKDK